MGLQKHYFKYGQSAREKIFGIPRDSRSGTSRSGAAAAAGSGVPTPLSMLISQGTKFNSSKYASTKLARIVCIMCVIKYRFTAHGHAESAEYDLIA